MTFCGDSHWEVVKEKTDKKEGNFWELLTGEEWRNKESTTKGGDNDSQETKVVK